MTSYNFLTDEQKIVVEYKCEKQNYVVWGNTRSLLNGLNATVISNGKHCMVINSLGYDENRHGLTWKIEE